MSIECRLVLVGVLAFAGCASAPERTSEDPASPPTDASPAARAAESAAASESEGSAGGTAAAGTTQDPVTAVEVAKLADTNPVTCRDMLVQGSNQMRARCMTRNDWKVFDQAQRIWAQDMLLRMQGLKR